MQNVQVSFVRKPNGCLRGHNLELRTNRLLQVQFQRSCFLDSFFTVEIIGLLTFNHHAISC
jgi:hypothetical protein